MTTRSKSKTVPKFLPPTVPTTTTTTEEIVDDNIKTTSEESPKQGNVFTQVKPNDITFSSIIPNDFSFKAPVGVNSFNSFSTSFKFEPMSPSSAQKFMFPSASSVFNDAPVTMAMIEAEKAGRQECGEDLGGKGDCVEDEMKDKRVLGEQRLSKKGVDCAMKDNQGGIGGKSGINREIEDSGVNASENKPGSVVDTVDEEAGSSYFQGLVNTETNRLQDVCSSWQNENDWGKDMPPEEGKFNNSNFRV